MSLFESMKGLMDARVDNDLGDSISYTPEGGTASTVMGFIKQWGDDGGMDGIDPAMIRWYAKIKKTSLPHRPRTTDRLTAAKLNGVPYQPKASTPQDGGDYWLFDLARV